MTQMTAHLSTPIIGIMEILW